MNIALIGLSGDPAHLGHLAKALEVKEMGYERVWWMITPQNPAKHPTAIAYWHRRELARLLALEHLKWLEVSDFEAGISIFDDDLRTFTLLSYLKERMPEATFTFVMGADNWATFHTWKNFEGILDMAGILVMPRDPWSSQLETCEATRIFKSRRFTGEGIVPLGSWALASAGVSHSAQSSLIRKKLAAGGHPQDLTLSQLEYIRRHRLYT